MARLRELAHVIRSKNAGPFEITFDVIFQDAANYHRVKRSGILSPGLIEEIYGSPLTDIVTFLFFEPALAFKFTLKRNWAQGSVSERDTFGAQQYIQLLDVEIP